MATILEEPTTVEKGTGAEMEPSYTEVHPHTLALTSQAMTRSLRTTAKLSGIRVGTEGASRVVLRSGDDAGELRVALHVARRYRNRRIGELPKELGLTRSRSTDIPKIRESMERFAATLLSTDEGRSYFLVEFPVHPQLTGVKSHDEAHEELTENRDQQNRLCLRSAEEPI